MDAVHQSKVFWVLLLTLAIFGTRSGGTQPVVPVFSDNKLQFNLSEDGSRYIRLTMLNQVWLRYNENNPGTLINGEPEASTFDIGIRRLRFQLYGQLTEHVFFYAQFGQNNFGYHSPKYTGAFFHDAIVEHRIHQGHLSIGAGLTGWSGLSRYASPSVGSILSLDAPLYQQATNGVNDQFLRKLSVYAKGKLSKLDYRVALSKPMTLTNPPAAPGQYAEMNPGRTHLQSQGYFMWQFLESEANLTPYTVGSYLGKKRVFNLGAGFIHQGRATYRLAGSDTLYSSMTLLGIDVFADLPLNAEKGTAFTGYWALNHYDFGQGYLKNISVFNPAPQAGALAPGYATFNGAGNGFPGIGTGTITYAQAAYLLPKNLLGEGKTLQPYAGMMLADFDRLDDLMLMYHAGSNLMMGGPSRLSLDVQLRPVFYLETNNELNENGYKPCFVAQYMISF